MWYKDWFADERYLALYKHRNTAEAEQLLDLIITTVAPKSDSLILDLACGAGRHSIALAKRGYTHVTGIDLSTTLIKKAKEAAREAAVNVSFIESDMRSFTGQYDVIMNVFTSFGYFETDADNEAVITHVGESLATDGYFVLDFLNAKYLLATINPHSIRNLDDGEEVEEFREIANGRVNKKIIISSPGCKAEYKESVRLFDHLQLDRMITQAGMTIIKMFGTYSGESFSAERSPRCIIVSIKNQ
jgi:SAM-dependent methyltransferase